MRTGYVIFAMIVVAVMASIVAGCGDRSMLTPQNSVSGYTVEIYQGILGGDGSMRQLAVNESVASATELTVAIEPIVSKTQPVPTEVSLTWSKDGKEISPVIRKASKETYYTLGENPDQDYGKVLLTATFKAGGETYKVTRTLNVLGGRG